MNLKIIVSTLGSLIMGLGVLMLIPGIYGLFVDAASALQFFELGAGAIVLGMLLRVIFRSANTDINNRSAFVIVAAGWFTCAIVGGLPYLYTGVLKTLTDAFFETASGFTGCGASVFTSVSTLEQPILLWRSMTQWLGGMGMVLLFVAVFPFLGAGGVWLFRAETPGPSKDKITPRVAATARTIWYLYTGITLLCIVSLVLAGMSAFDAVNHSFTTLATGGFSTKDRGIADFANPAIDYVLAFFMLVGAVNYTLYYRLLIRRELDSFFDTELKAFLTIVSVATITIALVNWTPLHYLDFHDSFRMALFTVATTISTTGYTNADYLQWPVLTHFIIVLLMLIGGMSGSTAGGLKVIRIVAALKMMALDVKQILHPHAVLAIKINGRTVRPELVRSMWAFVFIYLLVLIVISSVLLFEGVDLVSATTATISALSDVGPAFGRLGPMDNYAFLGDPSKIALSIGMILGRLEFLAVLILFLPEFWRKY